MACLLYRTDGTKERITPPSGSFTLDEMHAFVGAEFLDIGSTNDGRWIVFDDYGKMNGKPLNRDATRLYIHGRSDVIVGDAIIADTRAELGV